MESEIGGGTMRNFVLFVLVCSALALQGQDRSSSLVYNSSVVTNKAWQRNVVMRHEPTGEIYNDKRTVGSGAALSAATATAEAAAELAEAANTSMTNQLKRLDDAASSASTNCLALALVVRPETSRTLLIEFMNCYRKVLRLSVERFKYP